MIKNKKLMMALSFTLGAVLLVSTAFADILSTSGYEQLKQAIKYTSKACSKDLESFTMQTSVTLKDNEKILLTAIATDKFDNVLWASEHKSSTSYYNGITEDYDSYDDKECSIWYNSRNDTYQIYEYEKERERTLFPDIFEEDETNDIEKIIDAAVGNLKDYVIVENTADGSKEFSGSLDNSQIPALINAISSFAFKYTMPDLSGEIGNDFPKIQNDIFIKKVTGKATVNKDGILETLYGSGVISGKDNAGTTHDLTLEMLVRIYDINSTTVTKPDLTGKNVEKRYADTYLDMAEPQIYIGKYKQDIVIINDNTLTKIGERILIIEHIDDQHVSGKYYETYEEEYAEYSKDKLEFDFDAEMSDYGNANYELIDDQNNKTVVNINFFVGDAARVYLNIDHIPRNYSTTKYYDSLFIRVFED